MKTGLIMEGGAMRGMFTCGVIDVMMENGITFDGAVGVSAGAVFGCNLKSRQIGRPVRYNKRFCADPRYGSFRSLLKTGDLFDEQFCYHKIPDELDPFDVPTYRENPMEFYVTCTDVRTGKPVYHLCMKGDGEDIQWMRASASMPVVSRVVKLDGYELLDGGIADSIPVQFLQEKGYDRNVVILTQPKDYRKKPNRVLSLAARLFLRSPGMQQAVDSRYLRYNAQVEQICRLEEAGELFVIRPPQALNISSTESNPEELERVYQIGRKTGKARLEALKAYLSQTVTA